MDANTTITDKRLSLEIPDDGKEAWDKHWPGIWILDMITNIAQAQKEQEEDAWTRQSKR